ncbi:MAG: filamentous hemagglutinin N-terminal domain-containing protein [Chlamydiales bacterium]|nr:filamentous hemagglutinin N-terminal domain-containing protein [Chlamydiales bacterium]
MLVSILRFFLCCFFVTGTLFGLPQDLQIQSGIAAAQNHEKHLHIKTSSHAILHWSDFSIGKGESVHFTQDHSKSVVLNRVNSNQTSHLLGQLTSNGQIFLINPNGIVIGAHAHIQTAGFLASTANITNEDFLKGHYLFSSPGEGEIINHGTIHCPQGDIYLLAKTIHNDGNLEGENVSLVSAYEVVVTPNRNKKVSVRLDLDPDEVNLLTSDLETINPYEKAIHHTGTIEAFGTKEEKGKVYLIAQKREAMVDGTITVEGGEVQVLGENVHLTQWTDIDASGATGGTILIGGDYQGRNPEIFNAENVRVDRGALVRANSLKEGDGGKVIYWSDGITFMEGQTEVKGGPEGGNGGFIEVSGEKGLIYEGKSDRRAPQGKNGTILFDPEANITISGGVDTNITTTGTPPNVVISPTASSANLNNLAAGTLLSELANGDVTITTSYTGGGGASGNITFSSPFSWSTNSLTCLAANDVLFNANVTNTGTGNFTVEARRLINFGTGVVVSSTSTTTGGDITLKALGIPVGNYIGFRLRGSRVQTNVGKITIEGQGGTTGSDRGVQITFSGQVISNSGDIDIVGTGKASANQADGVNIGYSGRVQSTSGSIRIHGIVLNASGGQGIQLQASGLIATGGNGTIELIGTSLVSGNTILIQASGQVSTDQGNIKITGNSANGVGIYFNAGGIVRSTGGDIECIGTTVNGDGILFLGGAPSSVTTAGNLSFTGTVDNDGRGINISSGTIVATGNGTIILNGTGGPNGSDNDGIYISGSGNYVRSANGDITLTGNSPGSGGSNNHGIRMLSNGVVQSTGSGDVTLYGTGGNGVGVYLSGSTTDVRSGSGNILLQGTGGGTSGQGIGLFSSAAVTTGGNGTVTLKGEGSLIGTGNNLGMIVNGINSIATSSTGEISLEGTGGGTGGGSSGVVINGSGQIYSPSGNITIIGKGSPVASGTSRGIDIKDVNSSIYSNTGSITLNGTAGGGTLEGMAVTDNGQVYTSGSIFVTTFSNILVENGGVLDSQGNGEMLLRAATDIIIGAGGSVTSNTGPLTLVVDNAFPTFPGIGLGVFELKSGGVLTSGGELRIYTASQSQNSVDDLVNGVIFMPGPIDMDTATEQWKIYYPDGTYGGANYKFYYKDPFIIPPTPMKPSGISFKTSRIFFENIAANLVELSDLLPLLNRKRTFQRFPNYHFKVCWEQEKEKWCAPTFSPYGSFIFEDDLWWTHLPTTDEN